MEHNVSKPRTTKQCLTFHHVGPNVNTVRCSGCQIEQPLLQEIAFRDLANLAGLCTLVLGWLVLYQLDTV